MRDEVGQPGAAAGAQRAAGELDADVLAVLQAAGRPLPPVFAFVPAPRC